MAKSDAITPTRQALEEALALSGEILRNIELSETALSVSLLKASRLARLLNDHDHQLAFEYEASGYPSEAAGVPRKCGVSRKSLAGSIKRAKKIKMALIPS
ncbi:hypothetical protein N7E02_18755 [Aliirhizobium terrae]|uniref:AbiTii domain-containing protein n=1 Tax=Terrirhizobium terrae TaxID=2926709 RepID=UPI002575FFDD|nr:hypothetical protein [Rhizobium sp. CC-CFT758]WJH38963.1 hypothetical protein N7E02_18755 [Rhizobium sp. CC-CFT758]